MHVTDYSHCQAFAEAARATKIEIIRYASVRDPALGMNLALLTGVTDALGTDARPRLDPAPGRCCVALEAG
jgi:hypothetical protein